MTLEKLALGLLNDSCYNEQDGIRIYTIDLCCMRYEIHANISERDEDGMPINYNIIHIEKN